MNSARMRSLAATIGFVLVAAGCQSSTDVSPDVSVVPEPSGSAVATPETSASPSDAAPTPSAPKVDEGAILQVLVDDLRMRADPSTDSEALAGLSNGQLVRATGNSDVGDGLSWIEIEQRPSGRTGWVASVGPDGSQWLALVQNGPLGITAGADAELVDPASGERTPLTSGMRVQDLAFAPDGESVGLIDVDAGARIVALEEVPIEPSPSPTPSGPVFGPPVRTYLTFAPNGEILAYLEGQNLLALSLIWLGEGAAPTFPLPSTLHPISWSPDSRRLAGAEWVNVATGEPENWEIVVAAEGESEATRLTDAEGTDVHPAWSPDGSTIAFLRDSGHGSLALTLMDADGANQRTLLTFDGNPQAVARPSWSPDGSRIAIAQQLEGFPAVIHLVDPDTSEHLSVGAPADRCDDLTWSPTGTRIAFVCGPADFTGTAAYVTSLTDPEVTELGPASDLDWARSLEPISGE